MINRSSITLAGSYFLFFAVLGIFIPYFNLYCASIGFSKFQIGIILGAFMLMRVISPIFWGNYADHGQSRKKISMINAAGSAAAMTLALFTQNFWALLIIITIYAFFRKGILPMIEASTWEFLETHGGEYGKIRLWGSMGFIAAVFLGGMLLDHVPVKAVLVIIIGLSSLLLVTVLGMPSKHIAQAPYAAHSLARKISGMLRQKKILIFLTVSILLQISHGAYYGFFTLFMEAKDYNHMTIGFCWTLGVLAEVIVMLRYQKWFAKSQPFVLIIACCFIAAWRWHLFASQNSLAAYLLAQCLHAFSFGLMHIASMEYLNRNTAPGLKTTGLGLYSGATYGIGGAIGMIVSGTLYDQVGAQSLFAASALVALAAGITAAIYFFTAERKNI